MTKEEKDLLIRDLCGRLPYGTKIEVTWWCMGEGVGIDTVLEPDYIEQLLNDNEGDVEIKPYLRRLSSMTNEEKNEYKQFLEDIDGYAYSIDCVPQIDWLNANNFDYRGLIDNGLANVAPEGMYN